MLVIDYYCYFIFSLTNVPFRSYSGFDQVLEKRCLQIITSLPKLMVGYVFGRYICRYIGTYVYEQLPPASSSPVVTRLR